MWYSSKLLAALVAAMTMTGCSTLDVWSYRAHDASGTPPGETAVFLVSGTLGQRPVEELLGETEVKNAMTTARCSTHAVTPPTPPVAAAAVPIISSIVQLGVEAFIDKKRRDVDAIVEASQATYTANLAVSPLDLARAKCIVVIRYTKDKDKLTEQMVAVLDVTNHGTGATNIISFQPVFVRAKTSVATTRETAKPPTVSFSFGVSVKAVAPENKSIARLVPAGEAVASAPDVVLGGAATCTAKDCGSSDLLPFPINRGKLSVTVAVSEKGSTGFNGKVVDAELAAIKGALGPAIGEAVKTKLSSD